MTTRGFSLDPSKSLSIQLISAGRGAYGPLIYLEGGGAATDISCALVHSTTAAVERILTYVEWPFLCLQLPEVGRAEQVRPRVCQHESPEDSGHGRQAGDRPVIR